MTGKTGKISSIIIILALALSACATPQTVEETTTTTIEAPAPQVTTATALAAPIPSTTTTTVPEMVIVKATDLIVYGDSAGAVGAAVTAAREGLDVVMVMETGYIGGQMSAAGISSMDEHGSRAEVRQSGLYGELYDTLIAQYGSTPTNTCYFGKGTNPFCPEPSAVQGVLQGWVMNLPNLTTLANFHALDVIQDGNRVTGVQLADTTGNRLDLVAPVTIDGSEMAVLYPLIEGLEYSVGNGECVQKTTWSAIRKLYPDGLPAELTPPADVPDVLTAYYGEAIVNSWLTAFRSNVNYDGYLTFPGWSNNPRGKSWSPEVERGYRMMAADHSGINNGPVDQPISAEAMTDPTGDLAKAEYLAAKDRTWLYLWYEYYELGVTDWGLADDQGYRDFEPLWESSNIPDEFEQHFPLIPYVRERARIFGVDRMVWSDIYDRSNVADYPDSVMVGGYMTDQHGCEGPEAPLAEGEVWSDFFSSYGLHEVPMGVFIPFGIEGFMPGIVAGASVDRLVAGDLRMQPQELLGGQVVGTIAVLAVMDSIDIGDVSADAVRAFLVEQGVVVDG